ncbi:MAG: MBL fold metallo-hydrolase [Clostridia bacterium]|nr:MBL fold metallo-hydrolase [Clostridia bacterium]
MKITWLGQAGLMLETEGVCIIVDPYLSNSVAAIEPHNERRVPVDERFLSVTPDILVLTHNHLDHTDPETLAHYLGENTSVCVLASENAYLNVRKRFGGLKNNYVRFNAGTEWTERGIRFRAVYAEHSDSHAIGVLIEAEGKVYYVTGDTLYNARILSELPKHIDCVFIPVNGVGNNMNMTDAKRFCEKIGAPAVPMHCGLFDGKDLNDFAYEKKIIPNFYKEIVLK